MRRQAKRYAQDTSGVYAMALTLRVAFHIGRRWLKGVYFRMAEDNSNNRATRVANENEIVPVLLSADSRS